MSSPRIQRALISVSDKAGIVDLAQGLAAANVELYSTGGTRRHLEDAGLKVFDVAAYTGFPEMMHGRLKTLHPKVFGGILYRYDQAEDRAALAEHGIHSFELVVVNLYPFESTVARPEVTAAEAIEQIDIGGPSLVRAAAKNHAFITIATRADQYGLILEEIRDQGCTSFELRRRLAAEAFTHTAAYDSAIAAWFASQVAGGEPDPFPETLNLSLRRCEVLRYGENPHQRAALYAGHEPPGGNLVSARQLNGKELSYNNLLDLDSALAMVRSLPDAAAVVIKHNNPCGAASAQTLSQAALKALEGDPVSAFGSVLGFNRTVDEATAEVLCQPGRFVEAVVAPDFSPDGLELLKTRPKWKTNVRLMEVGSLQSAAFRWDYRRIAGGMLVQEADAAADSEAEWTVVSDRRPTDAEWRELRFAWAIVRHVKSNAIVLVNDQSLIGCGAGQMSRVDSVEIAIRKAGDRSRGSALASDAFFPFADGIEAAAPAGVTAVIQPGGSKNDAEVIAACNRHAMTMVFTGRRHFKH